MRSAYQPHRALFDAADDSLRGHFFDFVIKDCITQFGRSGTAVVDVGANGGGHTRTMALTVGSTGKVIAFEPDFRIRRDKLEPMQREFPWIHLYPTALSDSRGTKMFYLDEVTALSSLYIRSDRSDVRIVDQREVEVSRLDDIPEIATAADISLIKIDVEGNELKVLAGSETTMCRSAPLILIEIDWSLLFESTDRFVQKLHSIGYSVMDFFGEKVIAYDPHAWNVALVPTSVDERYLSRFLRDSGERFFRDCRTWTLY